MSELDWADALVRRMMVRYARLDLSDKDEPRIAFRFAAAAQFLRERVDPKDQVEVTL